MTKTSNYFAAAFGVVAFILYSTSSSWVFAVAAFMLTVIFGLFSFTLTSFVLRLYRLPCLPQLFNLESKKLSCFIWSGKYSSAVADPLLLASLTKSYSQLPFVLGEKRKGFLIPARVDAALEELLDTFLRLYVCSWYEGRVSSRPDFTEELRHAFGCVLRSIYQLLLDSDMAALISKRIAPVFLKHLYITRKCSRKRNMRYTSAINLANSDFSRAIMRCYASAQGVHPAVSSTASEALYLRSLVDVLLPLICPPQHLVVESGKIFLREALASKLLALVNFLANPLTMNKILFLWASPSKKCPASVSSWRLLLADYGWRQQRTTPLLCFTLQEIRPERNGGSTGAAGPSQFHSRLLYSFQQFLRRRGSTYLDLYILYQEISIEVIPVFFDARLLATDDVTPQAHKLKTHPSIRRNLYNKIQELYRAYVDPDALRSPTHAETADEPVIGSDPCDSEGVRLAQAWQSVVVAGPDSLVDPDTVSVFQFVKQYLENRLQPLIHEFNQSDLSVTVFKNISTQNTHRESQLPTRKQIVDNLVKGVYKFSSSSNGKLVSGSDYLLNSHLASETDEPSSSGNYLRVSESNSAPKESSQSGDPRVQSISPSFSVGSGDSYGNQQSSSLLTSTEIPDLSAWRISVPFVEFLPTNKQSASGSQQSVPVYVVSVRRVDFVSEEDDDQPETDICNRFYMPGVDSRNDDMYRFPTSLSSDENKRRCWNVRRYLDQFYLLEQKLKERYGELTDSSLPPRSRVFVLLREDRAFYEKRRRIFERFLQSLFEKSELRHSRLLYNFLTTDEGFNQRSPGEGSIGRKILRTVLVKSENRPLDAFLNGFQQVAEATSLPSSFSVGSSKRRQSKRKFDSDSESVKSMAAASISTEATGLTDDSPLFPTDILSLYGDNAASLLQDNVAADPTETCSPPTSDPVDLFDLLSTLGLDLFETKIATTLQSFNFIISPALTVGAFIFRNSTEPILRSRLHSILQKTLCEDRVAGWIRILTEALVPPGHQIKEMPTWNDYFASREKAIDAMIAAGLPEEAVNPVVDAFQEPVANKQLLYMLLDAIIEEVCPSEFSESRSSDSVFSDSSIRNSSTGAQ